MNFLTESELREMWQNGRGTLPVFPPGTRFSAAAQDFIKTQQLEVRYLSTVPAEAPAPGWDNPGSFPVVLDGPIPVCSECGQPLHAKPEHMTQVDASHFAPKTSPRIIFRGQLDNLHALTMLTSATARRYELPDLARCLDTLAAYCREIMSAEYNARPTASLQMMGKSEAELHEISHWPEKFLGLSHLVPGPLDHEILHWLNLLRTQTREVEVLALKTYPPDAATPSDAGASLARALNRLSSAIYVLELYFQSGELSWKVKG